MDNETIIGLLVLSIVLSTATLVSLFNLRKQVWLLKDSIKTKKTKIKTDTIIDILRNNMKTLYRLIWLNNKESMTKRYYDYVRTIIIRNIKRGDTELTFPLRFNMLEDIGNRKYYNRMAVDVLTAGRDISNEEIYVYLICSPLDEDGNAYAITCTGPLDDDYFLSKVDENRSRRTIKVTEYNFARNYNGINSGEGACIGYLVKKKTVKNNNISIVPSKDNEMLSNKIEDYKYNINFCGYLIDLIKLDENNDIYKDYQKLKDKSDVLPTKEDEEEINRILELLNDGYKEEIKAAVTMSNTL